MLDQLKTNQRLLLEAELTPIQGDRFQPTGFPDIGPATYQLADGTRKLLVESAQSMANRLEAVILGPDNDLVPELQGLSYVKAKLSGASDAETNTLIEAHRLNSPYIITDEKFKEAFQAEANYYKGKPLDWRKIAKTVFKYDVNSLLHGLFLANLEDGRVKIPRALSGFVEASDVGEVVSGGVKNNPIDPTGKIRAQKHDKDVYSNVPYQRVEFTAGQIAAHFNLDLGLIKSYELGDDATDLLIALGLYKIQKFFHDGLRLRTACDLRLKNGGVKISESPGATIPATERLLGFVQDKIKVCSSMFADPPVTQIDTATVAKSDKKEGE